MPAGHSADDAISSSVTLLQLERWIDGLLLRISNQHETKSHPNIGRSPSLFHNEIDCGHLFMYTGLQKKHGQANDYHTNCHS